MSVKVAEGIVEVTADATKVPGQIARDIDDNQGPVEQSGRGMGGRIAGGILAGFAAVGGIAAVAGWFTGAVSGASDLNETVSKSNTIFGSSAGVVNAFADTAARSLRMRDLYSSAVWLRFIAANMRSEPACTGKCTNFTSSGISAWA